MYLLKLTWISLEKWYSNKHTRLLLSVTSLCIRIFLHPGGIRPVEADHATEEETCPYRVSGVQSRLLCYSHSSTETIQARKTNYWTHRYLNLHMIIVRLYCSRASQTLFTGESQVHVTFSSNFGSLIAFNSYLVNISFGSYSDVLPNELPRGGSIDYIYVTQGVPKGNLPNVMGTKN